jgi:hypothetical protein
LQRLGGSARVQGLHLHTVSQWAQRSTPAHTM